MSRDRRSSLLLRHRDFRLLWCSGLFDRFGASVTGVAMPLLAVSTMDATAFQVGLLSAATWLPWLIIGLPAGVWVDRLPRRPIMVTAAAVCVVLFVGLPIASYLGLLDYELLLALALLTGAATVFYQTAHGAYLPTLLDPEDLPEGNAKLHGGVSAAHIVGLGSGGLIVRLAGAVDGLVVNAASFAASLICLTSIKHREPAAPTRQEKPQALHRELSEGYRLLFGDPWLRTLTLFGTAANLALMSYQSIQVVFLVRTVGLNEGMVGGLLAAVGTGGIAGAFVARRLSDRIGTARAILFFQLVLPTVALLMPLTFSGPGILLFFTGSFCVATGVTAGNVLRVSFEQRYLPATIFGRVIASTSVLNFGSMPIGSVLGGSLGSALGVRPAMWITCAAIPCAALILYFSPIRHSRDMPLAMSHGEEIESHESVLDT
ncbi:MFS transporter [Streptomyces sp. NPDC086077]|uniref:MFS transporter n=1 Tax=Streptomyces sp. NPDC086077 TaxID=3154862 RepID=UPI0034434225